jgi:hypothetical protein
LLTDDKDNNFHQSKIEAKHLERETICPANQSFSALLNFPEDWPEPSVLSLTIQQKLSLAFLQAPSGKNPFSKLS